MPERFGKLCVLGCACTVLYLFIAAVFWTDALFRESRAIQNSIFVIVAALTILYFAGIAFVRQASVRTVVVFALLFALIGFIAGPFDSTDIFYYIAQGWEQSHYNGNPYSQVLRDIPGGLQDPMITTRWMKLNRNPWLDEPLPYGFAFALVARCLAWLGGGNWWLTFALFNLLNVAIHGGMAYLLWKIAKLIPGADPRLILYLYAWSPLVVLQYLANAHNDIMMASLIVLAFYLFMTRRYVWVMPSLVAAGFVKYVAFALAPFVLTYLVQHRAWKQLLKTCVASAALTVIVSLPYLSGFHDFKFDAIFEEYAESTGSLHAFVTFSLRAITRIVSFEAFEFASFSQTTKILLWGIVGLFALYQIRRAWLTGEYGPNDVVSRWTSMLFAIVFVGSSQFYSWYIGMLFPLSLLGAGRSVLTDIVVMLSGTHLLFAFLKSKAIGYFLLSTAAPIALILWRYQRSAEPGVSLLATGLAVVKPADGSITSAGLESGGHGKLFTS